MCKYRGRWMFQISSKTEWKMDWPFEDLTDNEEYKGNGQRHPQVAGLGVYSSIPVLQVSPAQALWKPEPLLPEPFAQLRHHPETQDRQGVSNNSWGLLSCKGQRHTCCRGRIHTLKKKKWMQSIGDCLIQRQQLYRPGCVYGKTSVIRNVWYCVIKSIRWQYHCFLLTGRPAVGFS